ncbi:hypothetical protein FSARC_9960 [Fusarium sarcochroum]|uniref:Uncharacterized protein n=1 Tax=Fusarium sarcochroum TaxID=1208366 RepID=A0A8H4TQA2_9HYPO|nr:hypothetical protein FSARC_9960 [Fusarium sarcochroum]
MGRVTLQSTSPALQEATEALMTIMANDAKFRGENKAQAEAIKQIIHPFNEAHIESIRRLSEEIDLTLASIQSLDSTFALLIKPFYAQFLQDVMGYTGNDAQALATLNTIAEHFRILNDERQSKFACMSEQLDRYTTAMAKFSVLKHTLKEKKML